MNIRQIVDYYIKLSPSIKSSLVIVLILCIVIFVISHKLKKHDEKKVPHGIILVSEMLVGTINKFSGDLLGERGKKYAPYILTIAIFIFISNISGLFGFHPPTANVTITVALGIMSGFLIQFTGIKTMGFKKYFKELLYPHWIMLPMNILGELLTPFSMGMRLFGNILSGTVIMAIIYSALVGASIWVIPVGAIIAPVVTPLFHAVFDIFFGFIQTFVFILLTGVFIAGKLPEDA